MFNFPNNIWMSVFVYSYVICHPVPFLQTIEDLRRQILVNLIPDIHLKEFLDNQVFVWISESWSEAVKILKAEYCIKAIKEHNMDCGIIFCRTKLVNTCDIFFSI